MKNITKRLMVIIYWLLSAIWLLMAIACLSGSIVGFFVCLIFSVLCAILGYINRKSLKENMRTKKAVATPSPIRERSTIPFSTSGEKGARAPTTTKASASAQAQEKSQFTTKKYKVTGMEHYKDALNSFAVTNPDFDLSKKELIADNLVDERIWKNEYYPQKVELIPEPENPVDPKAIKVIADGLQVGYIKSGSCAHLLKVIRENRIESIGCDMGGGPYKYIREEYDDEKDKEVYTLERDTCPMFVHLMIIERVST